MYFKAAGLFNIKSLHHFPYFSAYRTLDLFCFAVLLSDFVRKTFRKNQIKNVSSCLRRHTHTHTCTKKRVACQSPLGKEEAVKWGFTMYGQLNSHSVSQCVVKSFKQPRHTWTYQTYTSGFKTLNQVFPIRRPPLKACFFNVWFDDMLQVYAAKINLVWQRLRW